MKYVILILSLVSTQFASAVTIKNSTYEQDHQDMIVQAISERCSIAVTNLVQTHYEERSIHIDNGITDFEYATVIKTGFITLVVESFFSDVDNIGNGARYSVLKISSSDVYCR